jgi:hypothetical protein
MNKINLVEAQERVQSFKKIFDAFHDAINNDASTLTKVKTIKEYDFHRKSQQYIADLDFLIANDITPKAKGIFGVLGVSQLVAKHKVLDDLDVMSNLSKQYSKDKAEYKAKIESDRKAQARAQQEEADRSAKSQKEINDFQKNVGELSRKAGYPNNFFSEKFRFFSFYRNTYDIFS